MASSEQPLFRTVRNDEDGDEESISANSSVVDVQSTTSGFNSSISSHGESENNKEGDSPAELIRKENRAISILRAAAVLLLIATATSTAVLVHRSMSRAEFRAFEQAFVDIGERITQGFLDASATKIWHLRSLEASIHNVMDTTGAKKYEISVPKWKELTVEARLVSNANTVVWSPFLNTAEERELFENYTIAQTDGGQPVPGPDLPCYVCGDPSLNLNVINREAMVELVGVGLFPCSELEAAGKAGIIARCQVVLDATDGVCECGAPPEDQKIIPIRTTSEGIWKIGNDGTGFAVDDKSDGPWAPMWEVGFRGGYEPTFLYNQMSEPTRARALSSMLEQQTPTISEMFVLQGPYYENYLQGGIGGLASIIAYPVFKMGRGPKQVEGSVVMDVLWSEFLPTIFPANGDLVDIVIGNSCGQQFTFRMNDDSKMLDLIGEGNLHEEGLEYMEMGSTYEDYSDILLVVSGNRAPENDTRFCSYRFRVYPTEDLKDVYVTSEPTVYTIIVCLVFSFTSIVFLLYDVVVRRRQETLLERATRSGNIVSQLFPENIRHRLYKGDDDDDVEDGTIASSASKNSLSAPKDRLKTFLSGTGTDEFGQKKPIADLFPLITVAFIDICGFTSWASERDPSQVFSLLEAIYRNFDLAAERRGVFKVETSGDCFVAAVGLPDLVKKSEQATKMVRFAFECLRSMEKLVRELESSLGPSTGDLKCRCGIHSGPVTAGVLRGKKSRFQLFGDTMNVASRIETNGKEGRIHVSSRTAEMLTEAGKGNWLTKRDGSLDIKGKGPMETFWVNPRSRGPKSTSSEHSMISQMDETNAPGMNKINRLIDWNVSILSDLLKKVVHKRFQISKSRSINRRLQAYELAKAEEDIKKNDDKIVFDEISQVIDIPEFEPIPEEEEDVEIPPNAMSQLRDYVSRISALYQAVPFHNFEHASHVTMSSGKLMGRIVVPEGVNYDQDNATVTKDIHDVTYGISSDPLIQFAIVFSALIHDVDHTGLSNAELVKMQTEMAKKYRGRSVAEQNSVDVAWFILMDPEYNDLRSCIYNTASELRQFRQYVVNCVMATDIADKTLQASRRDRWSKAFDLDKAIPDETHKAGMDKSELDRRATIVIEYIIQASDVTHTMQHWNTYTKWNDRLFQERYKAYLDGHEPEDPAIGWFEGEIGFFDFYIIPLAKKLKDCGVFGVSHDELLGYATSNRLEWKRKGERLVERMHATAKENYGTKQS